MTPIEERILIIKRYREEILSHLTEYELFYSDTFIKTQFQMMDKKISDLEAQKNVFISPNPPVIGSICDHSSDNKGYWKGEIKCLDCGSILTRAN